MRWGRRFIMLIPAVGLLSMTKQSNATTFVNRPLIDVINESYTIVRGRTGTSYSDWGKGGEQNRTLYTYTPLTVTEVIKEAPQNAFKETQILLRQPGGAKDGIEMTVPGAAGFTEDEDVVVLVAEKNSDNSYDVPGLVTGKYNVTEINGQAFLENSLGAGAVYDPNRKENTLSYNTKMPLDTFRKIAKGAKVPEAKANQFKSSSEKPGKGAFEGDHEHLKQFKHTNIEEHIPAPVPANRSKPWLPAAFIALIVAGAFGFHQLRKRGGI